MASNVIESIQKVLIEFEMHQKGLKDLCYLTFYDVKDLYGKIDFTGPAETYVTNVIRELSQYGRLASGEFALVKLMQAVQKSVGGGNDQLQALIQVLEEELQTHPTYSLSSSSLSDVSLHGNRPGKRRKNEERDLRNRQIMLERVRSFWVEGVLEKSLYHEILIQLGKQEIPEAVPHPWNIQVQETAGHEPRPIPKEQPIIEIFDELGHALLILGAPGSGKTITLLELARDAIVRAEADPSQPIPVMFNLSSWAERKQTLFDWLVAELKLKYQIPKKVAQQWLKQNDLLLLLDGLDEVKENSREACIDAINQFRQEQGLTEIVVCSRVQEYNDLSAKLNLQGAILLQPLTKPQVNDYLTAIGTELVALQTAMQNDAALQELAESPLMLNTMAMAYQGASVEAIQQIGTGEDQQKRAFRLYTERMLKRRGSDLRHPPQQTMHWLSWIAYKMTEHQQAEFFIEGLQAAWFRTKKQRLFYEFCTRLFALLIILFVQLIFQSYSTNFKGGSIISFKLNVEFPYIFSLFSGTNSWLIICGIFFLSSILGIKFPKIITVIVILIVISGSYTVILYYYFPSLLKTVEWSFFRFILASYTWLIPALLWGMAGTSFANKNKFNIPMAISWSWENGGAGLALSLIVGILLVTGWYSYWGSLSQIKLPLALILIQILFSGWIGQLILFSLFPDESKRIIAWGLIGITVWIFCGEIWWFFCGEDWKYLSILTIAISSIAGIFVGLLISIPFMLLLGLTPRELVKESITIPNYGIRRAMKNAVSWGMLIVGWVITWGGCILIVIHIFRFFVETSDWVEISNFVKISDHEMVITLRDNGNDIISWSIRMLQSSHERIIFLMNMIKLNIISLVLPVVLFAGGAPCIQHFTLRLIFSAQGYLPWKIVRFLNYAVERIFLRKVGGGYIFIHRMLMEYFASLSEEEIKALATRIRDR